MQIAASRFCASCAAWTPPLPLATRPNETIEDAQARMINAGRPLPKGKCRRFPASVDKDGDDYCFEWRVKSDDGQPGHADEEHKQQQYPHPRK